MKQLVVTTKDGKKHIFIVGSAEEFEKFMETIKKKEKEHGSEKYGF
jgi:PHD/YefM family antitoxin component YafN of YafNO toxin-antitoxin module